VIRDREGVDDVGDRIVQPGEGHGVAGERLRVTTDLAVRRDAVAAEPHAVDDSDLGQRARAAHVEDVDRDIGGFVVVTGGRRFDRPDIDESDHVGDTSSWLLRWLVDEFSRAARYVRRSHRGSGENWPGPGENWSDRCVVNAEAAAVAERRKI
jgi:hypothetical protein